MNEKDRLLQNAGINTRLAHIGNDPSDYHGFVNPPVVRASTVLFPDARSMDTRTKKYTYGTRGTPTTDALCEAIDALEGSAGTVIVPSGLTASGQHWPTAVSGSVSHRCSIRHSGPPPVRDARWASPPCSTSSGR